MHTLVHNIINMYVCFKANKRSIYLPKKYPTPIQIHLIEDEKISIFNISKFKITASAQLWPTLNHLPLLTMISLDGKHFLANVLIH